MQFVRKPNVRWRVLAVRYPAPLCERCNVPLAFNGSVRTKIRHLVVSISARFATRERSFAEGGEANDVSAIPSKRQQGSPQPDRSGYADRTGRRTRAYCAIKPDKQILLGRRNGKHR